MMRSITDQVDAPFNIPVFISLAIQGARVPEVMSHQPQRQRMCKVSEISTSWIVLKTNIENSERNWR